MAYSSETHVLPTRGNLQQFKQSYLKQSRTWFTADVVLLEAPDGARFVMKDTSNRPVLTRELWCRLALGRELKVYKRLVGMKGVPQFITQLDSYGFVMEWLEASQLPRRKLRNTLGIDFFKDLADVVKEMHGRGVAHGDLRRQNILLGIDGQPRLIDFETAIRRPDRPPPHRLFNAIVHVDSITILKIKNRYYPEALTEGEKLMMELVPWHLRLGRFFRQHIYGPLSPKGIRKRNSKRGKLARRNAKDQSAI